jgi:hypothetical protein
MGAQGPGVTVVDRKCTGSGGEHRGADRPIRGSRVTAGVGRSGRLVARWHAPCRRRRHPATYADRWRWPATSADRSRQRSAGCRGCVGDRRCTGPRRTAAPALPPNGRARGRQAWSAVPGRPHASARRRESTLRPALRARPPRVENNAAQRTPRDDTTARPSTATGPAFRIPQRAGHSLLRCNGQARVFGVSAPPNVTGLVRAGWSSDMAATTGGLET